MLDRGHQSFVPPPQPVPFPTAHHSPHRNRCHPSQGCVWLRVAFSTACHLACCCCALGAKQDDGALFSAAVHVGTRSDCAGVSVLPEADLAAGTASAKSRTSFLACVMRRQDGPSPFQSSVSDRSQVAFPDAGTTVAANFGMARYCGRCITSCGAVLATRSPFCVTSDAFHPSSTDHLPPGSHQFIRQRLTQV